MKNIIITFAVLFCLGISTTIYAAWPEGEWTVLGWNDETNTSTGSWGNFCIAADGTWTSGTDWSGYWFKRGNELHMHGNSLRGVNNDHLHHHSFELRKVSPGGLMSAYAQEWSGAHENHFRVDHWYRQKWTKAAPTCGAAAQTQGGGPLEMTATQLFRGLECQ